MNGGLGKLGRYFDLNSVPDASGRSDLAALGAGCRPVSAGRGEGSTRTSGGETPGVGGEALVPGGECPPVKTLLHYLAVALGVLAKYFIRAVGEDGALSWLTVASSFVISAVMFPYVYKKVCDRRARGVVPYFVSLQHGFFFQTVLEQVADVL